MAHAWRLLAALDVHVKHRPLPISRAWGWLPALAFAWACQTAATDDPGLDAAEPAGVCVGLAPADLAWQATSTTGGATAIEAPQLGEMPADFTLPDVQPRSCGYHATYGLQTFRGHATLVTILAGW